MGEPLGEQVMRRALEVERMGQYIGAFELVVWSALQNVKVGLVVGGSVHEMRIESTRTSGPVASAASASAASASAASPSASEFLVEVPVMVNTKAVSSEQELMLHRPKTDLVPKAKAVNLAKMINAKQRRS